MKVMAVMHAYNASFNSTDLDCTSESYSLLWKDL